MKRRITALLLGLLVVLPITAGAASGEPIKAGKYFVLQNYETEDSAYFVTGLDSLSITKKTENDNTYAVFDPSTELMYKNFLSTSIPEDFAVIADLCKMSSPSLGWQFHVYTASGNKVKWSIPAAEMETGVWYTYLTVRKDDVLKTYRKVKGGTDFTEVEIAGCADISSGTNMFSMAFWKTYGAEPNATIETTEFYADNISIFTGTFAVPDTAKITVTDEGGNKRISASADVISDTVGTTKTIAPILAVFDAKNKIIGWKPLTVNVNTGRTTLTNEITLTSEKYEAVRGGTAELYLWESATSFMPITKGTRCVIQ